MAVTSFFFPLFHTFDKFWICIAYCASAWLGAWSFWRLPNSRAQKPGRALRDGAGLGS